MIKDANGLLEVTDLFKIALDTNVLLWMFYESDAYIEDLSCWQLKVYPKILKHLIKTQQIYVTSDVLVELFKIIEQREYKNYCKLNEIDEDGLSLKEFRKIDEQYELLKEKCNIIYIQIENMFKFIQTNDTLLSLKNYIGDMYSYRVDVVDYLLFKSCLEEGIENILTDDGDFKIFSDDITIWTCNKKALD